MKLTNIKIQGHRGTWYEIARTPDNEYALMESEIWGDEAAASCTATPTIPTLEDVYNGFDDLFDPTDREEN